MENGSGNDLERKWRWDITDKQYVVITNRNRVAFRFQSNNAKAYRGVSLRPSAFESLCKHISSQHLNNHKHICLGQNIWMICRGDGIFLSLQPYSNSNISQFFRFKPDMWKQYVDEVHDNVHKALKECMYNKMLANDRNKSKKDLKKKKAKVIQSFSK